MLVALDMPHKENIIIGGLITVVIVRAANVVKDIRENIRNFVGGRMGHYETLIQTAVDEGLNELEVKAKIKGYDGVLGVKITNTTVIDGGVELIIYGNVYSIKGINENKEVG